MKILVLNCGSSSLKFQLINMDNNERMAKGNFERIGGMKTTLHLNINGKKEDLLHIARDYDEAIEFVLEVLQKPEYELIKSLDEIGAVGHRIVHGGEMFSSSVVINDEVVSEIEKCIDLAPLHNPAGVAGIKAAQKVLPNIPMVAVFDTAFHQTMPAKAYIYQIPYRYYTSYKIRKYGFHGTSHRYVAQRISEIIGREDLKLINCHLGQGASLCAIKDGKSIDTSMGLTPLAGIPMATRCGDIDPAIIPYIMKRDNLGPEDIEEILNKQAGAWGVSGVSSDYKDIEDGYNMGDQRSILTLESQAYKIAQYIGQYMISLGGLDVLTFAGGVGENGMETRERICKYLEPFGAKLDLELNKVRGKERCISTQDSKIKIYVIPTNEELMIAKETFDLIKEK
ncbi:MAG TPA: acetate kinase [Candidatus Scatovivens faecipullorum]|nr:acetate kinase [Candidatus Scatovivens faecipullorum]